MHAKKSTGSITKSASLALLGLLLASCEPSQQYLETRRQVLTLEREHAVATAERTTDTLYIPYRDASVDSTVSLFRLRLHALAAPPDSTECTTPQTSR